MYETSCYSTENENKLVEIRLMKNYIFLLRGGGGGGGGLIERGLNKFLYLKRGAYL